jgi:hypothetical protein
MRNYGKRNWQMRKKKEGKIERYGKKKEGRLLLQWRENYSRRERRLLIDMS